MKMDQELLDLNVKINSADSPTEIAAAVSAIDSYLKGRPAYQNAQFFSDIFPNLIGKLFDYRDYDVKVFPTIPKSWIDTASYDTDVDLDLIGKLFAFLSPRGTLITSMLAVDDLFWVKYVFPSGWLPKWFPCALSCPQFKTVYRLCPLFKDRVSKTDPGSFYKLCFRLNAFDYYMFCFAYFPVYRGSSTLYGVANFKNNREKLVYHWTSSSWALPERLRQLPQQNVYCPLYLRLLYSYLLAFVPMHDFHAHPSCRRSLLYDSQYLHDRRAEFVVNLFVHYWLLYNDFWPLPINLYFPFDGGFSGRGRPGYKGLGEVIQLLVKYLNLSLVLVRRVDKHVESDGSSSCNKSSSADSKRTMKIVSWNATIQRPLYRFLARTFLFWPVGPSMKNISEVFSAWTAYIEPWKLSAEELSEFEVINNNTVRNGVQSSQLQYSDIWEDYVLSNYLFYTSLVTHFARFGLKFLRTDADVIVPMMSKIMDILTSSRQLLDHLKKVDAAYHSFSSKGGKSTDDILLRFLLSICEQLELWDADFDERSKHLSLFETGEDGGRQLLKQFIWQAEDELLSVSNDNLAKHLQCVQSLKLQYFYLFDVHLADRPPKPHPTIQWLQSCVERLTATMMVNDLFGNVKSD